MKREYTVETFATGHHVYRRATAHRSLVLIDLAPRNLWPSIAWNALTAEQYAWQLCRNFYPLGPLPDRKKSEAALIPHWLHVLALVALLAGATSATIIVADEFSKPQQMWIMNVVWPVVALFGAAITLWAYFRYGRLTTKAAMRRDEHADQTSSKTKTPFVIMVAKATSHCGSGCALGDILSEWLAFFVPRVAIWFGWRSLFDEKMFAVWIIDFIFAYVIGIAFQYFTIAPMRRLRFAAGLVAALKADTLSLAAWQVGMYGFMAFAKFYLFRDLLGAPLAVNSTAFWFAMQIAMICGFITSYPVNWWLLKAGLKERM